MNPPRQRIAIIGTGISGLGAAALLHPYHDITVYEKEAYAGGHSRTVEVETPEGRVPVDTGFIVFNHRTYPLLTKLFAYYDVPTTESCMSFGARIGDGWLEYGTENLSSLFAQKRNLLRPSFWRMIVDILRFNRHALRYLDASPSVTLGECMDALGMGAWFRSHFMLAMGGAIWSTPPEEMLKFPARSFVRFFHNHGLLAVSNHPQWHTVAGGSREYVSRLIAPFADRLRLGCGVVRITRTAEGVTLLDEHGTSEHYDAVVLACHADQALRLIAEPTAEERAVLGAFRYQPNRAVLHSDTSFMPKRRKAWASWVYLSEADSKASPAISLTYWMNHLQPLSTSQPLLVTLNPGRDPDPALVYNEHWFDHPLFDEAAIVNQQKLKLIQGRDRLWFCGAYQRYGFHEDGLGSAVAVARQMGIDPPWK